MIPVNKPFLPPIDDYREIVASIWERQWLTNMGPLSNQLERDLQDYLKINNLLFVTNGTVAIQMAIKALDLKGEIITTPFSFIATTSSIVWEGCEPVFVDIEEDTFNIDASKIEAAITPKTSAILATHVYGNPCDVYKIEEIAKKYKLKIIYDAAHAFNVEVEGKSIFEFGDISTCSLHATKLFHSTEGGLIISKTEEVFEKVKSMRNFGFETAYSFKELGINAKNSEFHAGMGLVNLRYIKNVLDKRESLAKKYDESLNLNLLTKVKWFRGATQNYAYYPIVFRTEEELLRCMSYLEKKQIFTRRYFYPSLSDNLPYLEKKQMKVTENIAKRVLCLPFYYDLMIEEVEKIAYYINNFFKNEE
uniref:DegT/DnrJ/EryC1/StrS family aminotransferase n=1 Tax=uncultured Tenacibaculum sp. TaxID=174713 RepID=UPI00261EC847|nr:DegT/DnrJ/EryC1/StrS family aminotransferase [uncultured Tenacibaculum sp.]